MKKVDLTGMKFGKLTVIEQAESTVTPNGTVKTMWRCKCDCGKENVIRNSQNLRYVPVPSCGCVKNQKTSERRLIDLTGKRFGRLTVIRRADEDQCGMTMWVCKCDCGNECTVFGGNLRKKHTTSCGCFREEMRPTLQFKHGYRHTRIYGVWEKMKARCCCPTNPSYPRYGGRGITICDEWKDDAEAFIKWAYANGYDDNAEYGECTIDRIDNNKGYSPDNCRIVDIQTQNNNRRVNRYVTHNGETHTVAEWSRILDLPYGVVLRGVNKGKSLDEIERDYKR